MAELIGKTRFPRAAYLLWAAVLRLLRSCDCRNIGALGRVQGHAGKVDVAALLVAEGRNAPFRAKTVSVLGKDGVAHLPKELAIRPVPYGRQVVVVVPGEEIAVRAAEEIVAISPH